MLRRHAMARSWCWPPSMSAALGFPCTSFVRGLLFYYGLEMQNINPNMILHIACFMTLSEAYLGMSPTRSYGRFCPARGRILVEPTNPLSVHSTSSFGVLVNPFTSRSLFHPPSTITKVSGSILGTLEGACLHSPAGSR